MLGKELDEEVLMDLREPGKNLSSQPDCSLLSDGATYGGENKANVTSALVYKYVFPYSIHWADKRCRTVIVVLPLFPPLISSNNKR